MTINGVYTVDPQATIHTQLMIAAAIYVNHDFVKDLLAAYEFRRLVNDLFNER